MFAGCGGGPRWSRIARPSPIGEPILDLDALAAAEGKNWVYHGAGGLPPDYRRYLVGLVRWRQGCLGMARIRRRGREIRRGRVFPAGGQAERHLARCRHAAGRARLGARDDDRLRIPVRRQAAAAWLAARPGRGNVPRRRRGCQRRRRRAARPRRYGARCSGAPRGQFFRERALSADRARPGKAAAAAQGELPGVCRGPACLHAGRGVGAIFAAGRRADLARPRSLPGRRGERRAAIDLRAGPARDDRARRRDPLAPGCHDLPQCARQRGVATASTDGGWTRGRVGAAGQRLGQSRRDQRTATRERSSMSLAFCCRTRCIWPTSLPGRVEPVKSMPARFDASRAVVEQFEAVSADGAKVPYFVVRPRELVFDGSAPTLLYGYGGFQVSMTPAYSRRAGQIMARARRRLCRRQYPRRRRVRPGLAPGGAQGTPAARLRRFHRRRRGSDPRARSPRRAASASWAARTAGF